MNRWLYCTGMFGLLYSGFGIIYIVRISISKMLSKWRLILVLCVGVISLAERDYNRTIDITIAPGSEIILAVDSVFKDYQKLDITSFKNSKSNKITFPCKVATRVRPFFKVYGQFNKQISPSLSQDFWLGGTIWDTLQVGNRLISVFESG